VESELIHSPLFICRTMDEGTKKKKRKRKKGRGS
jgi:hypothetical protein